jgi:MiaB/RimO family radical SAM methylthiotransferase
MASILGEVAALSAQGIKEVVLLGQNVNGYHDTSEESAFKFPPTPYKATPGFSNLYRSRKRELAGARFPDLLRAVAGIDPEMRVRFTSPHPKDFPEEVLEVVAETHNICAALHLPVQSGSSAVLERMRRGYSREAYLQLVENVRRDIPGVTLSTDIITGFCGESEAEHADSLSLMEQVQFEQAFMFAYSLRERTHAAHTMQDNVPEDIKQRRLREIIEVYRRNVALRNSQEDSEQLRVVLVEGEATKSTPEQPMLTGRTDGNKRVVFPEQDVPLFSEALANPLLLRGLGGKLSLEHMQKRAELVGQYALVKINKADSSTLRGKMISHITLRDYKQHQTLLTSSPKL